MQKIALCLVVLLAGCSHQISLMARDGGTGGAGVANESGKNISITIGDKTYSGKYIYDGGSVATTNSYGTATAYSGARSATATGSAYSSTYIPGSGNGKILASSTSGGSIRCDFTYRSGSGIGYCQDNNGREYDLLIMN